MSVVAGCSLLDGVILGADCRVTYANARGTRTYRDTVQKLIAITPQNAIGFVGDVATAADLIGSMLNMCHLRQRYNPISLINWLPRHFGFRFRQFAAAKPVTFMVGSVIQDRRNVVERKRAAEILCNCFAHGSPGSTDHLSSNLAHILAHQTDYVLWPDGPASLLYTMRSPDFEPHAYRPLDYVAIGSGERMEEFIGQVSHQIFSGPPMEQGEARWLHRSMESFLRKHNVESVGGMFPMIRLRRGGGTHITHQTGTLPDGPFYELAFDDGRWIQRNVTAGEEIKLLRPWELDPSIRDNKRFDDLRPSTI